MFDILYNSLFWLAMTTASIVVPLVTVLTPTAIILAIAYVTVWRPVFALRGAIRVWRAKRIPEHITVHGYRANEEIELLLKGRAEDGMESEIPKMTFPQLVSLMHETSYLVNSVIECSKYPFSSLLKNPWKWSEDTAADIRSTAFVYRFFAFSWLFIVTFLILPIVLMPPLGAGGMFTAATANYNAAHSTIGPAGRLANVRAMSLFEYARTGMFSTEKPVVKVNASIKKISNVGINYRRSYVSFNADWCVTDSSSNVNGRCYQQTLYSNEDNLSDENLKARSNRLAAIAEKMDEGQTVEVTTNVTEVVLHGLKVSEFLVSDLDSAKAYHAIMAVKI